MEPMRWLLIAALVIPGGLAVLAPAGQKPVQTASHSEWEALFDGRSLAGWWIAAPAKDVGKQFWKVQDGTITCDSRGRPDHDYVWLVTEREFSDFELHFEVRTWRGITGNSGVQIRSRYDREAGWMDGPQVDIHPPAPWRTGLIYDETRGVQRWIYPSLPNARIEESYAPSRWAWYYAGDQPEWNSIEILCQGTWVRTRVNGYTITDRDFAGVLDDAVHRERQVGLRGHIALQLHRGDELLIQFRNLRVRPLRREATN